MQVFGIRRAWLFGCRFIAGRAGLHAIVLIGLGVVVPLILQYGILGELVGSGNPGLLRGGTLGSGIAAGPAVLAVMALSYVLQAASYFTSWRVGLGGDRSLAASLRYGLTAGLLAIALIVLIGGVAALAARPFRGGADFLGLIIVLIPLSAAFALFYTVAAALIATAVSLILSLAIVFGAATGNVALAATMVGGSGAVVVLLLVASGVMLWVAARSSCATSIMARDKSLNPISAIRESWQLTWDDQWPIFRYLAWVSVVIGLLILVVALAVGLGSQALVHGEEAARLQASGPLLGLVAVIPMAFLAVLVPAGIYRELAEPTAVDEMIEVFG